MTTDHPSRAITTDENEKGIKINIDNKTKILVVFLTACLLAFYGGIQQTFGHLIQAYAYDGPLALPKYIGAQATSVYWITFTCFRLVAILLSGALSCVTILSFNMITTIIASIALCAFTTSEATLWVSCSLMGVGLSSTFGTLVSFLETNFPVHGRIVSALSTGGAVGSSCGPAFIGYLMGINIMLSAWFPLVFSSIVALLFILILIVC